MTQNQPPRYVPQNRLTQGMDLVNQYNAMYPPRAQGGQGAPPEAFQGGGQQPQGPALSPQEAAAREARWMAETGQAIDERGNVVQTAPPQGLQFSSNPGVIRRAPEPVYGMPGPIYGHQLPPGYYARGTQVLPPNPQVSMPNMVQPFAPVQSIQSIDLERGIVWADNQAFPFDLRSAQQVLYFALEVISSAFASQLGSLLQRYGLVVVPQAEQVHPGVGEGLQAVPEGDSNAPVLQGRDQEGGPQPVLPPVPRGKSAAVPKPRALPEQVPVADEGSKAKPEGDSPKAP